MIPVREAIQEVGPRQPEGLFPHHQLLRPGSQRTTTAAGELRRSKALYQAGQAIRITGHHVLRSLPVRVIQTHGLPVHLLTQAAVRLIPVAVLVQAEAVAAAEAAVLVQADHHQAPGLRAETTKLPITFSLFSNEETLHSYPFASKFRRLVTKFS